MKKTTSKQFEELDISQKNYESQFQKQDSVSLHVGYGNYHGNSIWCYLFHSSGNCDK
jgi:hypothetical protein